MFDDMVFRCIMMIRSHRINIKKQEHPRESIVEPPGLHQDGLNSLPDSGLKFPIINAHVMTFSNCKRKENEIKPSWGFCEHLSETLV